MEDQEVKLAFEVIKDRVAEIKKDQDWKEQLAAEWNEETEKEKLASQTGEQPTQPEPKADRQSVYSYSKLTTNHILIFMNYFPLRIYQIKGLLCAVGQGSQEGGREGEVRVGSFNTGG